MNLIMSSSQMRTLKLQASLFSLFSFINLSSENLNNNEHDNAQFLSFNIASLMLFELQSLYDEQYVLYVHEQEY
jgi:hypothetical protein